MMMLNMIHLLLPCLDTIHKMNYLLVYTPCMCQIMCMYVGFCLNRRPFLRFIMDPWGLCESMTHALVRKTLDSKTPVAEALIFYRAGWRSSSSSQCPEMRNDRRHPAHLQPDSISLIRTAWNDIFENIVFDVFLWLWSMKIFLIN